MCDKIRKGDLTVLNPRNSNECDCILIKYILNVHLVTNHSKVLRKLENTTTEFVAPSLVAQRATGRVLLLSGVYFFFFFPLLLLLLS